MDNNPENGYAAKHKTDRDKVEMKTGRDKTDGEKENQTNMRDKAGSKTFRDKVDKKIDRNKAKLEEETMAADDRTITDGKSRVTERSLKSRWKQTKSLVSQE